MKKLTIALSVAGLFLVSCGGEKAEEAPKAEEKKEIKAPTKPVPAKEMKQIEEAPKKKMEKPAMKAAEAEAAKPGEAPKKKKVSRDGF